jgi:hypothetical protein
MLRGRLFTAFRPASSADFVGSLKGTCEQKRRSPRLSKWRRLVEEGGVHMSKLDDRIFWIIILALVLKLLSLHL